MSLRCHQINLQLGWGGGEAYTVFLTKALLALGVPTTVYVLAANPWWQKRLPPGAEIVCLSDAVSAMAVLRLIDGGWILAHTPLPPEDVTSLKRPDRLLSCIAHMPLHGRDPSRIAAHDYVFGVSEHVLHSLRAAGISQFHPEPLLGIADLHHSSSSNEGLIRRHSRYDWDLRKGRDRILSWLTPIAECCRPELFFSKRPGITLGIVSRLTPIKQLPLLFSMLAPVLARHPEVYLEIFGAGGYASVRDLVRALRPIAPRVRFWGHQQQVEPVYHVIDYLMTGLPEKEALGLNVIEAQMCGKPVLAVDARPFTETVARDLTGLFYTDPRNDGGASFDQLLVRLAAKPFLIDADKAKEYLERFSEASFQERIGRACASVSEKGIL